MAQEWADAGSRLVAAETFLTAATAAARRQGLGRRVGALTARGTDLAACCQGASTPGLTLVNQVDPLSAREREIAAMASQGLRSRDIAESLVVSIRTVDNHLQAVYTKLGIARRRGLSDALRLPTRLHNHRCPQSGRPRKEPGCPASSEELGHNGPTNTGGNGITTAGDTTPSAVAEDHDAKAQLDAVALASHDAIISKDLDGRITSWNPAAELMYGYSAEEILGRHSSLLVHEDHLASEAELLSRVAGGERVANFRTRRIGKNGAILEVSLSMSPVRDDNGVILGMASASHDVGLALAETYFLELVQTTSYAVLCVDGGGLITLVNDQVQRLFGYTQAELIGQPVEMLIPMPSRAIHPALRHAYFMNPTNRPMRTRTNLACLRKDGTTFAANIGIGSVHIGARVFITATIADVSPEIAVQAALRESEARFRQMADSVDVGFVLRNLDPPDYLYVSPGFVEIYGFDPMHEHETPSSVIRRTHPDDLERVLADYWEYAKEGLPAHVECRIIRADGEMRWVHLTARPVVDTDGMVRRSAGTVEDIADTKLAEAAVRTARELTGANAAKNEFLSRMSHELRTPLNAVLGFAQLLETDELSSGQHDAVQQILNGGRHLLELINDVLDITTIESDQLHISLEPLLISELLTETIDLMTPLAEAADITLEYRAGRDAGWYGVADRRRLRQVILNLLSNAIKYNKGGGRVDVTCRTSGAHLDIVITDTGRGIRAEDLPRLFTPFDRLGAQATSVEGTGVGLALSQRLMSSMGGTLHATSLVDVGSTFTASIPLADHGSAGSWPA